MFLSRVGERMMAVGSAWVPEVRVALCLAGLAAETYANCCYEIELKKKVGNVKQGFATTARMAGVMQSTAACLGNRVQWYPLVAVAQVFPNLCLPVENVYTGCCRAVGKVATVVTVGEYFVRKGYGWTGVAAGLGVGAVACWNEGVYRRLMT